MEMMAKDKALLFQENELADLTIADVFIKGERTPWKYPDGAGFVIARTEKGLSFLNRAINEGYLIVEDFDVNAFKKRWLDSFDYRKVRARDRIHLLHKRGIKTPVLDYGLPDLQKERVYLDKIELNLLRLFSNPKRRGLFLKWWIRAASVRATWIERKLFEYMKKHLFNHRGESIIHPKRIWILVKKRFKR